MKTNNRLNMTLKADIKKVNPYRQENKELTRKIPLTLRLERVLYDAMRDEVKDIIEEAPNRKPKMNITRLMRKILFKHYEGKKN